MRNIEIIKGRRGIHFRYCKCTSFFAFFSLKRIRQTWLWVMRRNKHSIWNDPWSMLISIAKSFLDQCIQLNLVHPKYLTADLSLKTLIFASELTRCDCFLSSSDYQICWRTLAHEHETDPNSSFRRRTKCRNNPEWRSTPVGPFNSRQWEFEWNKISTKTFAISLGCWACQTLISHQVKMPYSEDSWIVQRFDENRKSIAPTNQCHSVGFSDSRNQSRIFFDKVQWSIQITTKIQKRPGWSELFDKPLAAPKTNLAPGPWRARERSNEPEASVT
jgi:hypothetical protein